jgi:hypothetical protein
MHRAGTLRPDHIGYLARVLADFYAGLSPVAITSDVLEQQVRRWESWPADIPQIRIDTEQPLANQVQMVLTELTRRRQAAAETTSV